MIRGALLGGVFWVKGGAILTGFTKDDYRRSSLRFHAKGPAAMGCSRFIRDKVMCTSNAYGATLLFPVSIHTTRMLGMSAVGKSRIPGEGLAAHEAPREGTVEAWAWQYIHTMDLNQKRFPTQPPSLWEDGQVARRIASPGRPPELEVVARSPRTPKPGALIRDKVRAQLFHTFWHHELQAAELFAWALLAFPQTPLEFRQGLLGILQDEVRHMALYEGHLAKLGFQVGSFPVRDWFWQRVPMAEEPEEFVALVSLGLESGNLDHGALFAPRLRIAGDAEAAAIVDQISLDEEAHVAFGVLWFPRLMGKTTYDFEAWRRALPKPLSPILFRGKPLDRKARARAGQSDSFMDALAEWTPPEA